MGDIVSQARLFIDHSGGSYQLRRVKSYEVSPEEESTVVKAVGVKGGAGYQHSDGGGEITLEVYRETGKPEVDYNKLRSTKELFTFTVHDELGKREQFRGVLVSNVGKSGDDGGSHMLSVKLKYLQRQDLN